MPSLFETLLGDATTLTRGGDLIGATAAIQRALAGFSAGPPAAAFQAGGDATVLDGYVREVPRTPPRTRTDRLSPSEPARHTKARPAPSDPAGEAVPSASRTPGRATFEPHRFSGRTGTRSYKLFVPALHAGRKLPLILMLHGCTQSPDDFATGTGMNELAAERGFLVLYPAQAPRSNQSKCWNWFAPGDQRRGAGEPALLAEMTAQVANDHAVDPDRIYVAGLSAGAAMADILGREYSDLFAAVGVHSGLAQGAAHDVTSAFQAMHRGARGVSAAPHPFGNGPAAGRAPQARASTHGPTIGSTATPTARPPEQRRAQIDAALQSAARRTTPCRRRWSAAAAGRTTRTVVVERRDANAPSLAEHWTIHGAGHAGRRQPGRSPADASGPTPAARWFVSSKSIRCETGTRALNVGAGAPCDPRSRSPRMGRTP
jgi:poly(hydroxyalkanoate) depolymerase family esterase